MSGPLSGGRDRPRNWAGNVVFGARRYHRPSSVEELQALVAGAPPGPDGRRRVRAAGTGHSFNTLADTTGDQVSVLGLTPTVEVDAERGRVSVAAGVRYGELARALHPRGLALHNLGSLPHISVGGAVATGTHGSGAGNRSLAGAVAAVDLVTADGALLQLDRAQDPDRFPGAVVALGSLGVVTRLELDVVPAFEVAQTVHDALPHRALLDALDEVLDAAYSVSAFTRWQDPTVHQVWVKRRTQDAVAGPDLAGLGAVPADGPRHPVPGMPAENCTPQGGVPGPWHERLPHFRLEFTPSSGEELQSEYFVDRSHAVPALEAITAVRHVVAPVLQISELRTVAADDLWLSPASGRDSVAFHFTWVADAAAVAPAVAAIERALAPFGARPHWGKVFTTTPDAVRGLYERFDDFAKLRQSLDPDGVFANALTDRYLGPTGG